MIYNIQIKPQAIKDGKKIPKHILAQIVKKIEATKNDLAGNIKQLTDFSPEYRLRVGNYRILFEVQDKNIIIYRIKHRKDAYK